MNPNHAPILGQEPVDVPEGSPGGTGWSELDVPPLTVVRMELSMPQDRVFEPFLLREAEELLDLRADVELGGALIQRRDKGYGGNVLDQGAQLALFLLAAAD